MALALYSPRGGYYVGGAGGIVGRGPLDGSDFVTAPERVRCSVPRWRARWRSASQRHRRGMESGAAAARQAAQVLAALDAQGRADVAYHIVEVSGAARASSGGWRRARGAPARAVACGDRGRGARRGAGRDAGSSCCTAPAAFGGSSAAAWDAASGRPVWQDRLTDLVPAVRDRRRA